MHELCILNHNILDFTSETLTIVLSKYMIAFVKACNQRKKKTKATNIFFKACPNLQMSKLWENHVSRRNIINYNVNLFCKVCHNLQRFCENMVQSFNNRKKGSSNMNKMLLVCKHGFCNNNSVQTTKNDQSDNCHMKKVLVVVGE